MSAQKSFPVWPSLAALAFSIAHLVFEHFTVGVQRHHLLNSPDLPAISNWFGLVTLPCLGVLFSLRLRGFRLSSDFVSVPRSFIAAFLGAFLYGAVLAISFQFDFSTITTAAFLGLFVCAVVFPIYCAEYIFGFVLAMTFIFGGVLPVIVAAVFALISFVIRKLIGALAVFLRKANSR